MDRASLAALLASCRSPLGRLADILVEGYLEEQRLVREAAAVKAETKEYRTIAEILRDNPHYTPERVAIAQGNWRALGARIAAGHRTTPGKRCNEEVGRGRCRTLSHRFATFAKCPKHHDARRDRMARIAAWERTREELARQRERQEAIAWQHMASRMISDIVRHAASL